jgi:tetratricopeptide (TPR) repeat protein
MLLLGTFLKEDGDLVDALSTFSRVAKKFPGSGRSWLEWGKTLLLLGKYEEAVEKMRKAVACQPDDPDARLTLKSATETAEAQRTQSDGKVLKP